MNIPIQRAFLAIEDLKKDMGIANFMGIDLDYLLPLLPLDIAQSFAEKRKVALLSKNRSINPNGSGEITRLFRQ